MLLIAFLIEHGAKPDLPNDVSLKSLTTIERGDGVRHRKEVQME
jgi:hypothetical protein